MTAKRIALLFCLLTGSTQQLLWADCAASSRKATRREHSSLVMTDSVVVKSEMGGIFFSPTKCDAEGNLYSMEAIDATSGIRKMSPKGHLVATFAGSAATDLSVWHGTYFAVTSDGSVYQLGDLRDSRDRVVISYIKDGSYRSGARLEAPHGAEDWNEMQIAVFPSGDFLIAGSINDPDSKVRLPFTGIFDARGAIKREIVFRDDADLQKMAEAGDPRVVTPGHEFMNSAVDAGQAESGEDGNVYLMRKISPAIFYAVSPAGEVVRRFTIDPGESDYAPVVMHTSGSRIAVEFWEPQSRQELIKVTDLEGHEIATYDGTFKDGDAQRPIGGAFACYAQDPERFIFLFTSDDGYLGFRTLSPR